MKLRCERDALVNRLGTCSRAASSRGGALPALSGLHLKATDDVLTVTGSDRELTVRATVTVNTDEPGEAVLPARLVHDIVRSLDVGAVSIEVNDDLAIITAGRSEFRIQTIPVEDYPRLGSPSGERISLVAEELSGGLRQVVMAASSDDSRPILTAVLMSSEDDGLRLVATDSYRLAVRDLPNGTSLAAGKKVLVPSRALSELVRVLADAESVDVMLGEQDVTFEVTDPDGRIEVSTQLIDGNFPPYRNLIPDSYPNELRIGREPLLEAVRRMKLMAREAAPLRMTQRPEGVELMAITQDVGEATEFVDGQYVGDELTVAFNPDYLIAGIEAAPGDEVVLKTVDALKPAVLQAGEGSDFTYLLMPVRVS